jgi:NTE family protein
MGESNRALVLGGGGVTGIAWELGVLLGLQQGGADVVDADLIVGTSAGATVAAQIGCGESLSALVAVQEAPLSGSKEQAVPFDIAEAAEQNRQLFEKVGGDASAARRQIGAFALASDTPSEAFRRAIVAARLPANRWPERRLLIVAVDAATGEARAFEDGSEAQLVDAVAASCAVPGVWPPVTIGERRYVDGAVRTICNADYAAGCAAVLVLSPMGYYEADPISGRLREEVDQLERNGSRAHVIVPDAGALKAIGPNVLDPAARAGAARAGVLQGLALAEEVAGFWSNR